MDLKADRCRADRSYEGLRDKSGLTHKAISPCYFSFQNEGKFSKSKSLVFLTRVLFNQFLGYLDHFPQPTLPLGPSYVFSAVES